MKDDKGEPLIGASVLVKGTTNGTITGIDGDFTLANVKKGDIQKRRRNLHLQSQDPSVDFLMQI